MVKNLFKTFVILSFVALLVVPAETKAVEIAKYGSDYLGRGVGVRVLSLGGAGTAAVNDVSAGFWNPALLLNAPINSVGLMHTESFAGAVNFDYVAGRLPTSNHNLGLTLIRSGIDNIPNTQNALVDNGLDGIPNTGDAGEGNGQLDPGERLNQDAITYFNASNYDLLLSYALQSTEKLTFGANFKLLYKSIANESAFGLGFDAGAAYKATSWLNVGGTIRNFTTTLVAWSTGRKEIYKPEFRLGAAGHFSIDALKMQVQPTFDFIYYTDGRRINSLVNVFGSSLQYAAGIEFVLQGNLALRVGRNSTEDFTAGLGVSLGKARIEYGFTPSSAQNELGNSHRVGLIWQF